MKMFCSSCLVNPCCKKICKEADNYVDKMFRIYMNTICFLTIFISGLSIFYIFKYSPILLLLIWCICNIINYILIQFDIVLELHNTLVILLSIQTTFFICLIILFHPLLVKLMLRNIKREYINEGIL